MPKKKTSPAPPPAPAPPPGPVTVTRLPVTRCNICQQQMAHQPGKASAVLTGHYRKEHLALALLMGR